MSNLIASMLIYLVALIVVIGCARVWVPLFLRYWIWVRGITEQQRSRSAKATDAKQESKSGDTL